MITFDPPRRAILAKNKSTSEETEMVYVHGLSATQCIAEHKSGEVFVISMQDHSIQLDPNTAAFAEAELRLQGMKCARMPTDNKK
jgi:hypothetical protein